MRQMWLDFLNLPTTAQFALVGACGFFASFAGILLLIHGRRAWYAWRLEVWRKRNLWPDGEGEWYEAEPRFPAPLPESEEKKRRRLNGLVEVNRSRIH